MKTAAGAARCAVLALSLPAALAARAAGDSTSPAIAGELTRVDFTRRSVSLKLDGRDARELDVAIGPETRILSHGRTLPLEELRPGDRVLVLAAETSGKRVARVVKAVGRPTAVPSPTSPAPAASALPAPSGAPG